MGSPSFCGAEENSGVKSAGRTFEVCRAGCPSNRPSKEFFGAELGRAATKTPGATSLPTFLFAQESRSPQGEKGNFCPNKKVTRPQAKQKQLQFKINL